VLTTAETAGDHHHPEKSADPHCRELIGKSRFRTLSEAVGYGCGGLECEVQSQAMTPMRFSLLQALNSLPNILRCDFQPFAAISNNRLPRDR
jgi:hypothetical protein